ncbi:cytochrome oxidase assembly [Trichoderma arundinaceum]|uniref:Cytochrome oxidase assembly n=1 Tax=Trichoderma arundinaceum TaxID=490622 RepID=A0A395NB34_TRIAR|nr:cytochrome oxidase assembly [Trichoderma arundinaceum]
MISRIASRRLLAAASRQVSGRCGASPRAVMQRRWMTPAPKPGDGPLMSRRADRELPDVGEVSHGWRRTFPIFLVVVAACSLAIFNYQKSSSPIISSTLYALRTSPKANDLLGDEIYFKRQIPWISGEMNQVKGRIDISFAVRGSKGAGVMRFASYRPSSKALFETTAWTLTLENGRVVDLLDGADPFRGLLGGDDEDLAFFEEEAQTKGFRQQGALNR